MSGFKLFGVRFSADSTSPAPHGSHLPSPYMRKSLSMGNLRNYVSSHGGGPSVPLSFPHEQPESSDTVDGYVSDDLVHSNSNSRERKKGTPWTEDEHKAFLLGLHSLGKGDWRGISRKFVKTRTPAQVASHAQKYFLRRNNINKRRRRFSLFDISADMVSGLIQEPVLEAEKGNEEVDASLELVLGKLISHGGAKAGSIPLQVCTMDGSNMHKQSPLVHMPLDPELPSQNKDMDTDDTGQVAVACADNGSRETLKQSTFQLPAIPKWPVQGPSVFYAATRIVKPTPIILKPCLTTDDTVPSSDFDIHTVRPVMGPTPLSYQLLEEGSRHSAFHSASSGWNSREIDGQVKVTNAISVP